MPYLQRKTHYWHGRQKEAGANKVMGKAFSRGAATGNSTVSGATPQFRRLTSKAWAAAGMFRTSTILI